MGAADKDEIKRGIAQLLPRLRRFGAALAGSQDEGDDVVQAAIERALTNAAKWESGTRLDSWLFKIMQNYWRDEVRKRRSADKTLAESGAGIGVVDGRQVTETLLMLAKTRERFARLSEEHRLALALVVIDGRSYQEAADQLDIPIGTLMSRLSRAREALREMIEGESRVGDMAAKREARTK